MTDKEPPKDIQKGGLRWWHRTGAVQAVEGEDKGGPWYPERGDPQGVCQVGSMDRPGKGMERVELAWGASRGRGCLPGGQHGAV